MKRIFLALTFLFVFFICESSYAKTNKIVVLEVDGAIGPATQHYIEQQLAFARDQQTQAVILQLDTPGGLETAMRGINKAILASPIPVITYVTPSGARAASAGTFILYASHIAAMAPGTNVGAASPVSIGGGDKEKTTSLKKAEGDAAAYIRSLAALRGRNADWAAKAVTQADSISADEALQLKVINLIALNLQDLIQKLDGLEVSLNNQTIKLQTANLTENDKIYREPNWRSKFLSIITDPNMAYILLLIGIYGLYFEFSNPGFVLPGVVGTIALLIALYAFQLLPTNYTGLGLIIMGILFMILEAFITSYGALAIGGIIAFIIGSILLFDGSIPGFTLDWPLIFSMSLVTALFLFAMLRLSVSSYRKKVVTGEEGLLGSVGTVIQNQGEYILIRVDGELWRAQSKVPIENGKKVKVIKVNDLILTVEPL